ncbi:glycosyltransferase [Plantibacter auratus]|uniref:glycosyltransferase n=1 Tax=Plantibacter auratus TaxID=272914 RepID=UPI003D343249
MPESTDGTTVDGSRGRLLIFGRYEPDKFRDLEALLSELDTVGSALELRMLTRPHIDLTFRPKHLTIDNRSRSEWIADPELAEALAWADVLVAPYEGVTESGTVNLALTAGTRVVAFRGGALSEHLRPQALVEPADYKALAIAALRAVSGPTSTNMWTANDRAESARLSWLQALRSE